MTSKTSGPLFHKAEGVFIHPKTCGSTVYYTVSIDTLCSAEPGDPVVTFPMFSASVSLGDCERRIVWHSHDPQVMLEKLDAAIAVLARARAAMADAKPVYDAEKQSETKKKDDP